MPPDEQKFPSYYKEQLEDAMREETIRFVEHLLRENRPVRELVDADYSFVNSRLAEHYGLPPLAGEEFRRVTFPADTGRGGVMTHASVLTATSNGVDTSPVLRGVWMLEAVIGDPPAPPPPDVEPLDPDVRGSRSIREMLEKHRQTPACNDCHRGIDPYGFALENFDPIGRWRKEYPVKDKTAKVINTSGVTAGGVAFAGLPELKKLLASHDERMARGLAEQLLSYGLGRPVTFRERPAVERIIAATRPGGFRFRDLVLATVTDPDFRRR